MSKVLVVLVLLLGAAAAYVATRPDAYHVERSTTVDAPAATVFAQIDDLSVWKEWSPWEKKDPAMKRSFSGPQDGKGARYAWEGKKAGAGSMEITEAKPSSQVSLRLDFTKPFKANNLVDFTMVARGDSTDVTWEMHGPMSFVSKIMHVVINTDRMVGKDFDKGLANLKAIAEK